MGEHMSKATEDDLKLDLEVEEQSYPDDGPAPWFEISKTYLRLATHYKQEAKGHLTAFGLVQDIVADDIKRISTLESERDKYRSKSRTLAAYKETAEEHIADIESRLESKFRHCATLEAALRDVEKLSETGGAHTTISGVIRGVLTQTEETPR